MDKYFCRGCLEKWQAGEIMNTCPGCLAHKHTGWSIEQLLDVYEPVLRVYPKAFFPRLERTYIARQRMPERVDVISARRWLQSSDVLPGFQQQQEELLSAFESSRTPAQWNLLDPETQLHALHLRYA